MKIQPTLLCILDGLGLNPDSRANAFHMAKHPVIENLLKTQPNSTLITHGEEVGLPAGQMGNSEVGHLNIGAGRVVDQWLLRIGKALKGDFLSNSTAYRNFTEHAGQAKCLHVIGLISDGGVHSHIDHLVTLLDKLRTDFRGFIALHVITDGRDTPPTSGLGFVKNLSSQIGRIANCGIVSLSGRYFAMDRDKRWDRVQKAYRAIALGEAPLVKTAADALEESYEKGVTDEFVEPVIFEKRPIENGDGLLFFNFREDRMRQIVRVLCAPEFSEFKREHSVPVRDNVLTFTHYDQALDLPYLFPALEIKNHLGEIVSKKGLKQLRVAETEKYPHVTYFFNGGIEKEYPGETRKLVPSPRDVKTYDFKPEMSAIPVTDIVVEAIGSGEYSLIVVNLANCDMVGHTGVLEAAVKAVETVDTCLGRMLNALAKVDGHALIIADHGNAEQMIDYNTGQPHTAHTTFPVPVILFGMPGVKSLRGGATLKDVAPTILKIMKLDKPPEMTGISLF